MNLRGTVVLLAVGCAAAPIAPTTPMERASKAEREQMCVVNAKLFGQDALKTVVIVDDTIAGIHEGEVGGCTERLDAEGGWVLPGFHDAHIHMMSGAVALSSADLDGAKTEAEIIARVRTFAESHPDHAWIIGRGWSFDAVPTPNAAMLASVDDRPIFLESYDGHAAWVNAKALAIAGVGGDGLLLENAIATVEGKIPEPSREAKLARLETAIAHVKKLGVTSVDDITTAGETFDLYETLERQNRLPIRVTVSLPLDGDLTLYENLRAAHGERFGYLKGFVDGVIESKTAFMLEPYEKSTTRGTPLIAPDRLIALVKAADAKGFRVALHCIGDAAVRLALDAFANTKTKGHRIEHIEIADPADLPRFAKLGVVASMQPYHANPFGDAPDAGVWSRNLGAKRLPHTFPWRDLLDNDAKLAFGSDWPVMSADPLRGLAVAMTRRDENGEPKEGWNVHQTIDLEAALTAYNSGELHIGAPADLVVLDPSVDLEKPATLWNGDRIRTVISK